MHTALAASFASARAAGGSAWLAAASAASAANSGGTAQFNTPCVASQPGCATSPTVSAYSGSAMAAEQGTPWLGTNGRSVAAGQATPVHFGSSSGNALYTPAPAVCSSASSLSNADRTPDAPGTPAMAAAPPPVIKGAGAGAVRRGRGSAATSATPHLSGHGASLLSELRAPRSSILRGSGAGAADCAAGEGTDATATSGGSAVAVRRSARFSLVATPGGHSGHGDSAEEEVPRAKKQHMAPARSTRPTSAGHVNNTGGGTSASSAALQSPAPTPRADFTAAVSAPPSQSKCAAARALLPAGPVWSARLPSAHRDRLSARLSAPPALSLFAHAPRAIVRACVRPHARAPASQASAELCALLALVGDGYRHVCLYRCAPAGLNAQPQVSCLSCPFPLFVLGGQLPARPHLHAPPALLAGGPARVRWRCARGPARLVPGSRAIRLLGPRGVRNGQPPRPAPRPFERAARLQKSRGGPPAPQILWPQAAAAMPPGGLAQAPCGGAALLSPRRRQGGWRRAALLPPARRRQTAG